MKSFELTLEKTQEAPEKILEVKIAAEKATRNKGLSGRIISEEDAMLFVFPYDGQHQMWMKDTLSPLDIIFMNSKGEIIEIVAGLPGNSKLLGSKSNVRFVLELAAGIADSYNIELDDTLPVPEEFIESEDEIKELKASLLDHEGKLQREIYGKERVFSREKTVEIIKEALKAESENEYSDLGKLVAAEIHAQNERGPEYVDPALTKYQYAALGSRLEIDAAELASAMNDLIEDRTAYLTRTTLIKSGSDPIRTIETGRIRNQDTIMINSKEIPVEKLRNVMNDFIRLITH